MNVRRWGIAAMWLVLAAAQTTARAQTTQAAPVATAPAWRLFTDSLAGEQLVTIGDLDAAAVKNGPAYVMQAELTSRGAAVHTLKLASYFATVADKQRYDDDPETYAQAMAENPARYQGHYSLLNPVGLPGKTTRLPLATGLVRVTPAGEASIAVALDRLYWTPRSIERGEGWQQASFEITVFRGRSVEQAQPLARFVKTYRVSYNDYSLRASLTMENLTDGQLELSVDQHGPTGVPREDIRGDQRQAAYANLQSADQKVQNRLKNAGQIKALPVNAEEWLGNSDGKDPVLWVGTINKFFASMMYLEPAEQAGDWLAAPTWKANFYVEPIQETPESVVAATGVVLPAVALRAGQVKTAAFDVFAGPKKRELFSKADSPFFRELYRKLNYIGTIDFGGCFCTFSWLALGMMWLLELFSKVALGNYGVAIIMLVLLVRLVMHPLTKKSQVSMMGMQKLGPKVQALKDKYADNKDALNREMAQLYKEQGPAQLLGCLPMLLQMPIWVALYTGLNASVELRHAAFLPVWITDLAAPDALFHLPSTLPLIGDSFNLLPILLGAAMFFQMKYSPQSAAAATSPEQAQQQKMMKLMMPAMMLVFFYKAPSGLTLYIMASTFAGLVDQHYVRKHIEKKKAEEAALETTVRVPGKASRSTRPKKPKGPFWTKHG